MQATQATIDQWTSQITNPLPFEDYGPTADRPLPTVETGRQWHRQLREAGFCPDSLAEAEGIGHGHVMHGYHPADEYRDRYAGDNRAVFQAAEEAR